MDALPAEAKAVVDKINKPSSVITKDDLRSLYDRMCNGEMSAFAAHYEVLSMHASDDVHSVESMWEEIEENELQPDSNFAHAERVFEAMTVSQVLFKEGVDEVTRVELMNETKSLTKHLSSNFDGFLL